MKQNGNGNAGLAINAASLQIMCAISGRVALAAALGKSFGGNRDLYQALGYPRKNRSSRQDMPRKRVF